MRHIIAGKAGSFIGLLSVLSLSSFAVQGLAAPAPTVPDAGSILRDQQSRLPQPSQLPAREKAKEQPAKYESGVLVFVKGFKFIGYEGVATEAELQALVADAKGKTITFGELKGLADKITVHLKEKGWGRARAYLPKQDVTSGIVEIAVLQGASDGRLEIKMDRTARINPCVLRAIGEKAVRKGEPLNDHELERSVLLMNDLPGVIARASLASGTEPGTTRVTLTASERPIVSGLILGDNYGNHYTGSWRASTNIAINDPFRYGEQISAIMIEADGLAQGRLGYSMPLLIPGLRASLSYTGMSYELHGADFSVLDYKGNSNALDTGLSYSLVRSRTSNLSTSLSYGYKVLVDKMGDMKVSDKQLNSVNLNFNGDFYDQFWGGGASNYSVGVTTGTLNESASGYIDIAGKEGRYTRFNLALGRLQRLAGKLNMSVSCSAQMSLDNLDSSEKLSLGGPYAVRAYPVGEAPGDAGQLVSADLRYNLPLSGPWGNLQFIGFYDAGHIRLNKDRYAFDVFNDTNRNTYWLQGAGAGVNYIVADKGALRAVWAHVLGRNPGQKDGRNSDGGNDKNRFWLQGELYF